MKNIGIFCGGFSSEWEISMKSAQTICANFPSGFNVFPILVKREGFFAIIADAQFVFSLDSMSFETPDGTTKLNAAVVYVHGDPGENGKLQALLELKAIPYVNSGPLASALSFDKWYCNQFLRAFGIEVADSVKLKRRDFVNESLILEKLGLPVFVKPSDSGSSFGISKVKSADQLLPALQLAFGEGDEVVIESFLDGTEVTCGVYRGRNSIVALPLTEIASENEFFDYDAKYHGKSQEITPARISDSLREKVQQRAKYIYDLLGLRAVARIDFMLVNDTPYVIEVNTTPGFSPASIVPQMIACSGMTLREFWEEVVEVELQ
ncbi:MAG: D-alanine--D-alanine ligase [Cryomorphaceae bacterium]|jgi:D-alanine-D-alanine ligase|nr:D-alanine--D-alanine ligase [Cryomorphaceae bacterium]